MGEDKDEDDDDDMERQQIGFLSTIALSILELNAERNDIDKHVVGMALTVSLVAFLGQNYDRDVAIGIAGQIAGSLADQVDKYASLEDAIDLVGETVGCA